ncbi:MAG: hypothetical protein AUH30_06770 [Candidatus Rokubacteria bacterium 13_1_40CM_68_15]|nr:MAG: hypothetical protein AUH30_06770 [Candidatus Rokubacteria bacterium 13_1_40CM_68_15]
MKVIRMADYGRRMRRGLHAQLVHDQIAQALKASNRVCLDFADVESVGATFLDRSLGALVAWHGTTILQSLVFEHCSRSVALSIGKALPRTGPIRGLLDFGAAPGALALAAGGPAPPGTGRKLPARRKQARRAPDGLDRSL